SRVMVFGVPGLRPEPGRYPPTLPLLVCVATISAFFFRPAPGRRPPLLGRGPPQPILLIFGSASLIGGVAFSANSSLMFCHSYLKQATVTIRRGSAQRNTEPAMMAINSQPKSIT